MKITGMLWLLTFALAVRAGAQNYVQALPPAAGHGPAYDVAVGYSFLSSSTPSAGRVNLNGIDASGRADFSQHWGLSLDSGYVRTSDILGTGQNGYDLTLLAGPVFYPVGHGTTRGFIHALGGAGLVDSAVPTSGTRYLHGWVARPAYALGGGMERSLAGPFGIRFSGDYLRTAFVDSSATVRLQSNIRVTVSLVVRLRERHYGIPR